MVFLVQMNFECELCPRSFSKDTYLKLHRESHIGDQITPVQCNQCDQQFLTSAKYDEHVYQQHLDFSGEFENINQPSLLSFVSQQEGDITVTESMSGTTEIDLSRTLVSKINSDLNESIKESNISLSSPFKLDITPPLLDQLNSVSHLQVDLVDYFLIVHRKDGRAPNEGDFIQYFGITPESFLNCIIPEQLLMNTDISKGLAIDLKVLCDVNKYPSTVLSRFLYELLPPSARPLDTSCLSKQNSDKLSSDLQKLQFRAKKFRAKFSTLPKYLHGILLEKYHPFVN